MKVIVKTQCIYHSYQTCNTRKTLSVAYNDLLNIQNSA